jgi:hypothetical protein
MNGLLRRVLLLIPSVLALAIPSLGHAETAKISAHLMPDGSGRMIVNSQLNPESETWSWEACDASLVSCAPFAQGRIVSTAGSTPPTVFRAVSSRGLTALSPVWRGRVAAVRRPSVRGRIEANRLVTPLAGKWRAGWKGGYDEFQLAACLEPSGRECTTLTHPNYPRQCPDTAVVLDPAFTGWYLRVADRRLGPGPRIMLAYAVGSPYGHEIWSRNRTTSVAIVGRIAPATRPRTVGCGPPPLDTPPAPR